MKLAKGIAGAAFSLVCSLAYAGQYEYRIEAIAPNTTDSDCYEKIAEVGERFGEAAGVELSSTACFLNPYRDGHLDGVITYVADQRVALTELLQYGNYGIEETAFYASEEACREALADQTALFSSETGLIPHIAYCYSRGSGFGPRWRLQIAAVGESERKHYIMGVDLYGKPSRGYEDYWDEISASLTEKGLTVSKAQFASRSFYHRLTIAYYSSARKQLYHNGDVRLESPEACAAAEERAEAAFADLANAPVAIFCDKDSNGLWGSRLNIYTLEDRVAEAAEYQHRILPGFYEDLAACQLARPEQIERLTRQGVDVLEAFCGIDARRRIVLNGFLRK